MAEIELKLQVPAARRALVDAAVAGAADAAGARPSTRSAGTAALADPSVATSAATRAGRPAAVTVGKRVHLRAAYYDTPDRLLARAGLALRMRREGRRWVQTLKAAADDGLTRSEEEHTLTADDLLGVTGQTMPPIDPARHAGTITGDRLLALLAEHVGDALVCLYRTDIWRRTRTVRSRLGTVEIAFDSGFIVAGERRLPVCELEVELVDGAPIAVVDAARRWAKQHRLWLDTRSKAERGDLLARGLDGAPAVKATAAPLLRGTGLVEAQRLMLAACLDQVATNASQVASGLHDDAHVHQLRVGLRRLRTVLRLFDDAVAEADLPEALHSAAIGAAAATWFRRLGAARDEVAVMGPWTGRLERMRAQVAPVDVGGDAGAAPQTGTVADAAGAEAPTDVCRSLPAQMLLLAVHERIQRLAAAPTKPLHDPVVPSTDRPAGAKLPTLRDWFAAALQRWHRQVARDLRKWASLDDEAVHTLRKRAKRLRYAAEFAAPLYKPGAVRRYLRPLAELQEAFGALNDLTVAIDRFRTEAGAGPRAPDAAAAAANGSQAWFALGFLASQREAARAACLPAARALRKARPFWKG